MRGYDAESYGEAFADVYDDWYAGLTDVDVTVRAIATSPGRAAACSNSAPAPAGWPSRSPKRGIAVTGIDTSSAMLDRLAARDPDRLVEVIVGDMVDDVPPGPFDLAFVAYNTIFNLLTEERQRRLLRGGGGVAAGRRGLRRRGVRARSGGDRRRRR